MSRKLTCDETLAYCVDQADGVELEPDLPPALEQHLEGCEACRGFVSDLGALDARLRTTYREAPEFNDPEQAAADAARVMAAIKASEARQGDPTQEGTFRAQPFTQRHGAWQVLIAAVVFLALGLGIGRGLAPAPSEGLLPAGETPGELNKRIEELESELRELQQRLEVLEAAAKRREDK